MEAYSTSYNRTLGTLGKYRVVDLFPYKIKERKRFVNREHVEFSKAAPQSVAYAAEVWRRMVEGLWVEDADGTRVYMMPNVYFHANLGHISIEDDDKNRFIDVPDLRDNEWIIHTYILCLDGFSGFEDDDQFTCNIYIKMIEEGKQVPKAVMKRIEKTCRRPDGEWKRYINAWDYLTWFYLIEQKKRHKNLGLPLYQNPNYNGCILSSRKVAKTFNLAVDLTRNFLVNGVKRASMLKKNPQVNFFVGATSSIYLNSFMVAAEASWRNVPGGMKGQKSPYFREAVGPWTADIDPIVQGYRTPGSGGEIVGTKSMIAKAVLIGGAGFSVVSKRYLRIYEDEGGLDPNSQRTMKAADASLKGDRGPSGSYIISGTGGYVKVIGQTKGIFYDPKQFRIFGIPDYWDNMKEIGLFMSAAYSLHDFKDPQGMTELMDATQFILDQRHEISDGDENKITDLRANEPLHPPEMFLSGGGSIFNQDVIQDRIDLLEHGLFRQKGRVYELELGKKLPKFGREIRARVVEDRWHNVIDSLDYTMGNGKPKTGELVVFEPPIHDGEGFETFNSMYKVVYDPHQDLPSGGSYASIKVYKGFPKHRGWDKDEMFFNTVATFKGRLTEDDEHALFLKLCLWYRCRGQYERNVSGVRGFFKTNNALFLLQEPPLNTIKEISPTSTQRQTSGIVMTDNAVSGGLKSRATGLLVTWHNSMVYYDEEARRQFIQIETSYDLSFLYELANYNDTDNFDDISAYRVLMLWLKEEKPAEEAPEDDDKSDMEDDDLKQLSDIAYELVNV